jgi:phosphatidylglycerophosphate synthase
MANALSILRVLLVVPLLCSLHRDGASTSVTTVAVLAVAALSDLADGFVARRLFMWRQFPGWLLGAILLRDAVIIAAGCYLLRAHGLVIGPNHLGKYATVSLIVASLAYLLPVPVWLRSAVACLAGAMLVASSISYGFLWRRSLEARQRRMALGAPRQRRSA